MITILASLALASSTPNLDAYDEAQQMAEWTLSIRPCEMFGHTVPQTTEAAQAHVQAWIHRTHVSTGVSYDTIVNFFLNWLDEERRMIHSVNTLTDDEVISYWRNRCDHHFGERQRDRLQ